VRREAAVGAELNVKIVLGRCCSAGLLFGMRFEETGRGRWVADWAFPMKEGAARREKFDRTEVGGIFAFAAEYPGCPGCGVRSVFQCGCGKVACWDAESKRVRCPWCGQSGTLDGTIDRLVAGGDA
jgi:hypothetical protein